MRKLQVGIGTVFLNVKILTVPIFLHGTEHTWNDFLFEFFSGKREMVQCAIEKIDKICIDHEMCYLKRTV